VVLGLAIVWALFVPAADWLARHDVGSARGSLYETAVDNARGRLLTLGAGVLAAGALAFTARTFYLSQRTYELTEQGQVTDRYTKAIEQLGSDKLDVRIGGIYALERLAHDSVRDHPTVMEVLTAFIRERSCERRSPPDGSSGDEIKSVRPDVQAAITVVGRRDTKRDVLIIDLANAQLDGAELTNAEFRGANFTDARLRGAFFTEANLSGAHLNGADLSGAYFGNTNLTEARIEGAHLKGAFLQGAMLAGARLVGADLTDADLTFAILEDADLTRVSWPRTEPVPEGWERDADSGHLVRARALGETGTGADPAS
jgi:hypothetical protein